jgi:hypothetical protein
LQRRLERVRGRGSRQQRDVWPDQSTGSRRVASGAGSSRT